MKTISMFQLELEVASQDSALIMNLYLKLVSLSESNSDSKDLGLYFDHDSGWQLQQNTICPNMRTKQSTPNGSGHWQGKEHRELQGDRGRKSLETLSHKRRPLPALSEGLSQAQGTGGPE